MDTSESGHGPTTTTSGGGSRSSMMAAEAKGSIASQGRDIQVSSSSRW